MSGVEDALLSRGTPRVQMAGSRHHPLHEQGLEHRPRSIGDDVSSPVNRSEDVRFLQVCDEAPDGPHRAADRCGQLGLAGPG